MPSKRARPEPAPAAPQEPVSDCRYPDAKRRNIPPAGLAAQGQVREVPRHTFAYNPHLPPVLRFDAGGQSDSLPALLQTARERALTADEARLLSEALRVREPWLEWSGKREAKACEVDPVALHIHERVSAQAILRVAARQDIPRTLFADPEQEYREAVQFYRHDVDWANRLILGDSLAVMASLAKREDLAGKVAMIYMDPPYGIRFASNFQSEIGKRDVKDKAEDLTREPEMVKAYRDTWTLGVHSYLAYLRDRLYAARDLLADTGSIFVQISDDNVHRVRQILDEVFGASNFVSEIVFRKAGNAATGTLATVADYILWYAKRREAMHYRQIYLPRASSEGIPASFALCEEESGHIRAYRGAEDAAMPFQSVAMEAAGIRSGDLNEPFVFQERTFSPRGGAHWKTPHANLRRLAQVGRLLPAGDRLRYKMFLSDYQVTPLASFWGDVMGATDMQYVVQTNTRVVERCVLMATDPGDLVLDPTCGSGTTAFVAEQWGRRWIAIDTSRVALAIARQRLLTAKFDYYKLRAVDAQDVKRNPAGPWLADPHAGIRGACTLDCKTVPHITLKSIAKNQALDPIFAQWEPVLAETLAALNQALAESVTPELRGALKLKLAEKEKREGKKSVTDADRRRWLLPAGEWREWEVPFDTDPAWPKPLRDALDAYRAAWRQKRGAVDACIQASAEREELVDDPYKDARALRVSGPFTVEGVLPAEESLEMETPIGGAPEELDAFADGGEGPPDPPNSGGTNAGDSPRDRGVRGADSPRDRGAGGADSPRDRGAGGADSPRDRGAGGADSPRDRGAGGAESTNAEAYLHKMIRLLRGDGVLFPNNRWMAFARLEPLAGGILHAEGEWENGEGERRVAVAFGPQHGAITAKMVEDCIRAANRKGYDDLVFAGFSFDGAAQAVIQDDPNPNLRCHLAHIRPDVNMGSLLKDTPSSQLFTVFGLPRVTVDRTKQGEYVATMEGVDIYDPVANVLRPTGAGKVAAWFLDADYDGHTFCITQAFFPDDKAWDKLSKALAGVVDGERFAAFGGTVSLPFPAGKHQRAAVKVIDPRGNEVMRVVDLGDRRVSADAPNP